MRSRFDRLFSLGVSHTYYADACTDFDFVVPAESARTLGRGKLLARVRDGVLHVLFEGDEGGAPRVPLPSAVVRVGLRLNNPSLHNFTHPAPPVAPGLLLYRNHASPTALDAAQACTLVGSVFAHTITQVTRPVTVTVKDDGGGVLGTETVTAAADQPSVSFDLGGVAPGPVSLDEDYGAGGVVTVPYYAHPELQREGVSSVVEIALQGGFYAAAPAFTVAFTARLETLRYYLIVSDSYTSIDFDKLTVADVGGAEEPPPTITFTRVNDAIPAGLPPLVKARGLLFESTAPVVRRQRGRKKIQLSRNGEVLIEHLPQPGADRADANLILHISR